MKADEVATGGTKAETDQADGPRSTAKLEHKDRGKGTKAQARQRHGVVSGAGGHARLSGTVEKPRGWVVLGLGSGPELGVRTKGCWWQRGGCLDRLGIPEVHVVCQFWTMGL